MSDSKQPCREPRSILDSTRQTTELEGQCPRHPIPSCSVPHLPAPLRLSLPQLRRLQPVFSQPTTALGERTSIRISMTKEDAVLIAQWLLLLLFHILRWVRDGRPHASHLQILSGYACPMS